MKSSSYQKVRHADPESAERARLAEMQRRLTARFKPLMSDWCATSDRAAAFLNSGAG